MPSVTRKGAELVPNTVRTTSLVFDGGLLCTLPTLLVQAFFPDCTQRAWSDLGPRKTQLVVYLLSTAFVASELSDLALEKPEKKRLFMTSFSTIRDL